MFSVLAGTVLLAMVHALIPNHWLPLVAVAKAEKWKRAEVSSITFFAALAHVTGTVLLGLVLGLIGTKLRAQYGSVMHMLLAVLLIVFGLIYFTVNLPHHHHSGQRDVEAARRSKGKWIMIFVVMMFLSPCLEAEGLFLSAGAYGMTTVLLMSVLYAVISISGIMLLVNIGFRGISLLPAQFIEHNEKRISGAVLIAVGIISFFLY
jgi:nickel/cobalt transporter (NicO) family protein